MPLKLVKDCKSQPITVPQAFSEKWHNLHGLLMGPPSTYKSRERGVSLTSFTERFLAAVVSLGGCEGVVRGDAAGVCVCETCSGGL